MHGSAAMIVIRDRYLFTASGMLGIILNVRMLQLLLLSVIEVINMHNLIIN